MTIQSPPEKQGLYDPQFEHDACGVGFVCHMKGKRSHEIVEQAITILINLDHRGACGCEANTGDGAGILLQIPHTFLKNEAKKSGLTLPSANEYGVGMVFLPPVAKDRGECQKKVQELVESEGQTLLGWRDVPTDNSSLGDGAKASEPVVKQFFVGRSSKIKDDQGFERKLFIIRKRIQKEIRYSGWKGGWSFYIVSLSA